MSHRLGTGHGNDRIVGRTDKKRDIKNSKQKISKILPKYDLLWGAGIPNIHKSKSRDYKYSSLCEIGAVKN